MPDHYYVARRVPERFVEVDAARLLLIITRFAHRCETPPSHLHCCPSHAFIGYFAAEYYLQKLDFLLRYPRYFVYELTELFRMGMIAHQHRDELLLVARNSIHTNEPELRTQQFRKFWRGAYERLDDVEAWWYARELIYTGFELRGQARPWKYYFLTAHGCDEAERLVTEVPDMRWYADRIALLHTYFGQISPAQIKQLQYQHPAYTQAQLNEHIPDLSPQEIEDHFVRVFGEPLVLEVGA
jgi:hypothetical protein